MAISTASLILIAQTLNLTVLSGKYRQHGSQMLTASAVLSLIAWWGAEVSINDASGLFSAFALFGATCLLLFGIAAKLHPIERLNHAMAFPFAIALTAWAAFGAMRFEFHSTDIAVHAYLSIAAYAALAIGCAQAVSAANIQSQFKANPLDNDLPALDRTDRATYALLHLAMVLLTLALLSGALSTVDLLAQHVLHKTVLSVIAWFCLGTLLVGHHAFGWRGKAAYRWVIVALALLIVGYFGTRLALTMIQNG